MPALLARFLIDPVFFQDTAIIGKSRWLWPPDADAAWNRGLMH